MDTYAHINGCLAEQPLPKLNYKWARVENQNGSCLCWCWRFFTSESSKGLSLFACWYCAWQLSSFTMPPLPDRLASFLPYVSTAPTGNLPHPIEQHTETTHLYDCVWLCVRTCECMRVWPAWKVASTWVCGNFVLCNFFFYLPSCSGMSGRSKYALLILFKYYYQCCTTPRNVPASCSNSFVRRLLCSALHMWKCQSINMPQGRKGHATKWSSHYLKSSSFLRGKKRLS